MGKLLLLITSLMLINVNAQSKPLVIVCHEFAPFSYQDEENNTTGILVEIAKAACKQWPDGCDIKLLPNRRAKQTYHTGRANGHFLGWNKERALSTWFSIPLLQTEYGFFSNQTAPLTSLELLAGKSVAVFAPSNTYTSLLAVNSSLLSQNMESMEIISLASADKHPLKMLKLSRFDGYFVNKRVGQYYAKKLGLKNLHYLSSGQPIDYFIGFKIEHNSYEKVKAFNHLLHQLFQQRHFDSIFTEWQMTPPKLKTTDDYLRLNIPY